MSQSKLFPALLIMLCGSALGGCGVNRMQAVDPQEFSLDARVRHPIAVTSGPTTMDVFVTSYGLDERSRGQVAEFAQTYRRLGQGPISLQLPASGAQAASSRTAVEAIRRELARHGAAAPVAVSSYPISDPSLAAPIRLTFDGLSAKVAHRCGEWPDDLASASSTRAWDNKPYYNFGCASQNMLATQVADPRDLTSARAVEPPEAQTRLRAITNVRKGSDPSTNWNVKNPSIGSVGG